LQQHQQGEHAHSAQAAADDDSNSIQTENDVQQQQQQQHTVLPEAIDKQLPFQYYTAPILTNVPQQQQQFTVHSSAADSCEHTCERLPQVQAVAVDTPIDSAAAAGTSATSYAVADAACSEDIELLRANYKTLLGVVCREVRLSLMLYCIQNCVLQYYCQSHVLNSMLV
jgi:hypothetical protein